MQPLLFHKDVFIPDFAKAPLHTGRLRYSSHARNVSQKGGKYEGIALPDVFLAKDATLIEVEINPLTGAVEKQVWRQPLDAETDLCFPMMAGGFVKTVWLNDRRDQHATLNKNKFVGSFQWRSMKNKLPAHKKATAS